MSVATFTWLPAFHGAQIYRWLYGRGETRIDRLLPGFLSMNEPSDARSISTVSPTRSRRLELSTCFQTWPLSSEMSTLS